MAGTITATAGCTNNRVQVAASFNIVNGGFNGFNILVDGSIDPAGPFAYATNNPTTAVTSVLGDGQSHTILIRDVDDPACQVSSTITTPDCNASTCQLSAGAAQNGGCNGTTVPVQITVTDVGGGTGGFSIAVDGATTSGSPYAYSGTGTTVITENIVGDGVTHNIVVTDIDDNQCSTTTSATTQDCSQPCSLSDLMISKDDPIKHIVLVDDFEFIPADITVTEGDTVLFDFIGVIPHTTTSDATTGPLTWNSSLLGQGAQFEVIMSQAGLHPYYCAPHGGPGGVGMSGTIQALPNCNQGNQTVTLSFNAQNQSPTGFNVFVDGVLHGSSPYSYNAMNPQVKQIQVVGDGSTHTIRVEDASNAACQIQDDVQTVDCNASSTCAISLDNSSFSPCSNQSLVLNLDFSAENAGSMGYEILIDQHVFADSVFAYTSGVNQVVSIELNGSGTTADFQIRDVEFHSCNTTFNLSIPQCGALCQIEDLDVADGAVNHIVEVLDFEFVPAYLRTNIGDTVTFIWIGQIAHTTTSDMIGGWDSGLLNQGDTFVYVTTEVGLDPYYCGPHGGPGGIGMAGVIDVREPCQGDTAAIHVNFEATNGSVLGYQIFIDGQLIPGNPFSYQNPVGMNSILINIIGDGASHILTIQDLSVNFCAASTIFQAPLCGAGCSVLNLTANVASDITHVIEVRDFDFLPEQLDIVAGESIDFIWTGDIPHTSTSDALSGIDSWSSGLLNNGAMYSVTINTTGEHPYYCIPHGGPGGIGMAANITASQTCVNNKARVQLRFSVTNGSNDGYRVFIDGSLYQTAPFSYQNVMGSNEVSLLLDADGEEHIVTVQDLQNNICAASAFVTLPTCGVQCVMSNVQVNFDEPNLHIVEVRDFDFLPQDITVEAGDIVRFNWTGVIAHTATSDATSGNSSFNSGLLNQGAQYEIVITEEGFHPYFCIPHGAPGGIGMAGSISVTNQSANDSLFTAISFTNTNGGTLGYTIDLDGSPIGRPFYPYSPSGTSVARINLPCDGQTHDLTIKDRQDTTCQTTLEILIPDCSDPCFATQARFSSSVNEATRTVTFVNNSTGSDVYSWDFGDGRTSTAKSPTHTYDTTGTYTVCLTVTNTTTGCNSQRCDKVTLGANRCEALYSFVGEGLQISFTDESNTSVAIDNFAWDFGDGMTSSASDPTHTFNALGVYEICLTIQADSCMDTYCKTLDLSDPCLLFNVAFDVVIDTAGLQISITDQTSGSPDDWLWGFGDGSTSRLQNPTHTYNSLGLYTICLLTSNSTTGCLDNQCQVIDLRPTSIFTTDPSVLPFKIYPNPSATSLNTWSIDGIRYSDLDDEFTIEFYDFAGRLAYRSKDQIKDNLTVTSTLTPGLYVIRLTAMQTTYHATLMVL